MKLDVTLESDIARSPRVIQAESIFDVPAADKTSLHLEASLPLEDRDWNVGLVVGPSGAGKSRSLRALFGDVVASYDWSPGHSLLDDFPAELGIRDVTELLTSVGFSSVPSWLRPYHTLSTGEQFRAHMARVMAECPDLAVVDEFTSTVDRGVARVASASVARSIRRRDTQLVVATCHYDVEDWLQPDWVFQPHVAEFTWRSLQPRPPVAASIARVDRSAWRAFSRYHYLSPRLVGSACYGGFVGAPFYDEPQCVAFASVGHFPHPAPSAANIRRMHRQVVLPDWQGLGIGSRMADWLGEHYSAQGYRFRMIAAHPGMIARYHRSPRWRHVGRTQRSLSSGRNAKMARHQADPRILLAQTFEYQRSA